MTRRDQYQALRAANEQMVKEELLQPIVFRAGDPALLCAECDEVDGHKPDCSVMARVSKLAREKETS